MQSAKFQPFDENRVQNALEDRFHEGGGAYIQLIRFLGRFELFPQIGTLKLRRVRQLEQTET